MRPRVSRKATSSSPSSLTRTGGQSGSGSSHARSAGIQYRRMVSPIGVPRPTRVTRSFSSRASMPGPSSLDRSPGAGTDAGRVARYAENPPKQAPRQATSGLGAAAGLSQVDVSQAPAHRDRAVPAMIGPVRAREFWKTEDFILVSPRSHPRRVASGEEAGPVMLARLEAGSV